MYYFKSVLKIWGEKIVKIIPKGPTVLLEIPPIEEKSKGGIILHTEDKIERHQLASVKSRVVAMGELAFSDEPAPRCAIGDFVITAKYAGLQHHDEDTETWYRLVNDTDIIGLVEE